MQHAKSIDNETEKPEKKIFYNSAKGEVDALDERCAVGSSR